MTTTEQGQATTWADKPPVPLPPAHTRRTQDSLREIAGSLQKNPGRWAVYSTHATRGAARQRIYVLRNSATFEGMPLEWRSARTIRGDRTSPVQILVRWKAEEEDQP